MRKPGGREKGVLISDFTLRSIENRQHQNLTSGGGGWGEMSKATKTKKEGRPLTNRRKRNVGDGLLKMP